MPLYCLAISLQFWHKYHSQNDCPTLNRKMYPYEKEALQRIAESLKARLSEEIVLVCAFGSRVRGDHGEWSDFDVLVVVKQKKTEIERLIIDIFVEEEIRSNLSFTPVIKEAGSFELEKKYGTPFYENIAREGMPL